MNTDDLINRVRVSCLFSVASLFTSAPGSLGGTKVSTKTACPGAPRRPLSPWGHGLLKEKTRDPLPSMPIAGLGRLASALHSREQGVCAIAGRRARFPRLSPVARDLDFAPAARSTPSRLTAPLSLGPLGLSRTPAAGRENAVERPCRGPGAAWIASNSAAASEWPSRLARQSVPRAWPASSLHRQPTI